MMRQLMYKQSSIQIIGEMRSSNMLTVESQFVGELREHIAAKFHLLYWPDKTNVGIKSQGGSIY